MGICETSVRYEQQTVDLASLPRLIDPLLEGARRILGIVEEPQQMVGDGNEAPV